MKQKTKIVKINVLKLYFIILILLIYIILITPLLLASIIGEARIISSEQKEWKVTHTTDNDYFVWVQEKNKQKTQICLLSKTATKMNDIAQDKNTYQKDKSSIEKLTRKQVKASDTKLEKDYYGYCKLIDTEDYVKFGEASTIVEYQNESKIEYTDEFFSSNVTLYKNISGNFELSVEDIFVFYDNNSYKFGAIDNSMNETDIIYFRYVVNSSNILHLIEIQGINNTYPIFYNSYLLQSWGETQLFYNFGDVCEKSFADCKWEFGENNNSVILDFYSDKNIDPIVYPNGNGSIGNPYQITNCSLLQGMNESMTSHYILMNNVDCNGVLFDPVKLGTIFTGSLNGQYYNISNINISKSGDTRVGFFSDLNGDVYNVNFINVSVIANDNIGGLVGYFRGGNIFNVTINNVRVIGTSGIGNLGGLIGRSFGKSLNSFVYNAEITGTSTSVAGVGGFVGLVSSGSNISYCGVDNVFINVTAGSGVSETGGFAGRTEAPFYHNFADEVNIISGGSYVGGFVGFNAVAGARVDNSWSRGNISGGGTYVGGFTGRIASTVISNCFAQVNVSSTGDYVGGFIGYILTGGNISNSYSAGEVVASATYVGGFTGRSNTGTLESVYYDTNISGRNDTGKGTPYTTTQMMQQANFVNWDFSTPIWYIIENQTYPYLFAISPLSSDTTSPNATLISPPNNTLTNITQWNMTINATDDQNLSNITLFVYNETGSLINQTTIEANGTNGIFGIIYEFFTGGIFTWFYEVADWVGNTFITLTNYIIVDIEPPVMEYVFPTESNNSIIIDKNIQINITATDRNLSFIQLFIYNSTFELVNQTSSFSSPLYFNGVGCCDGVHYFNATSCDSFGLCSSLPTRKITFTNTTEIPITFILEMSQYPYIDANSPILFSILYKLNGFYPSDANVTLYFISPSNNYSSFEMVYNSTFKRYIAYVSFSEIGNYFLEANLTHVDFGNETLQDSFYVGIPYYVNIKIFEGKTIQDASEYKNDFAYVTAEYTDSKYYNDILENYITPLTYSKTYDIPVFYGEYEDGEATIKFYEPNRTYAYRLVDGIINFPEEYSVPNMTKNYGANFYLGQIYHNGTNQTLLIYSSPSEIHQYRALFNWIFIIGLGLALIVSLFLAFVIPEHPTIALTIGTLTTIMLIIIRIGVWFFKGW